MSVFTVFFSGTGSNSEDYNNANYLNGELISTLARNHQGIEFDDWLLADGPGSGNHQEDHKWTRPGYYLKPRGTLFGSGWEENVKHAIAVIKKDPTHIRTKMTGTEKSILRNEMAKARSAGHDVPIDFGGVFRTPDRKITPQALQHERARILRTPLPTCVNLIGWSRGAVTCHMMANAMRADAELGDIPVNIFAVDPVPGTGNFQASRTTLGANVLNYFAVYARDERSAGFAPIIPDVPGNSRLLSLPGRHATLAGNAFANGGDRGAQSFSAPGKVVRHLAEEFLTSNGTQLDACLDLNDLDLLGLYDEILRDNEGYVAMRSHTYTVAEHAWRSTDRNVGVGSGYWGVGLGSLPMLRQPPVFVNWHHRDLYIKQFANAIEEAELLIGTAFAQSPLPVTTARLYQAYDSVLGHRRDPVRGL
ncbi:hypothetical protein FHY12_000933 [Xanthomonas arboricola]|uniref:hypothetical protein n=1 Tax=Xanthomonas euroxanthea TaxID=2259622 RepID=UPI00141BB6BF|nr:hypothetical protein [Xanthomonas euroxanthea]NIK38648.1 hypothetical protein [Xanthomonas euroxanthea]